MQVPVLVEPVAGNGYRASGWIPAALTADGSTPEEALQKLRGLIAERLNEGARLVALEVPGVDHPWLPFAGMFNKDDPLVQEWKQAMAENRRKADADPDVL
jgi:hypothetical protein